MARKAVGSLGITLGRLVVVSIVAGYFGLLAGLGGHAHWKLLGVPPVSPPFMDMRSVTSGWECTRKGVPVLPKNPCDPYGQRPANYPRIWMLPSVLGLGEESTVALGIVAGLVFLVAAVLVLPREASALEAIVYGIALCAPAVMLGVERGNVDLLLFALVVSGVLLLRRGTRGRYLGHALILFAAILKLFPIFAAVSFVRQPLRKALLLGGAVIGLFAVYALATIDNIRMSAKAVPQVDVLAYGIRRFTDWLGAKPSAPWLSRFVYEKLGPFPFDLIVAGLVVAGVLLLRLSAPRVFPRSTRLPAAQRDLDLFYAGAGIYALSYVLFRSYDYRLVFVLLTIPQLLRWVRNRNPVAIVGLVAAFGVLFLDAEQYWLHQPGARQFFLAWHRVASLGVFSDPIPAVVAAQLLLFACYAAALIGTLRTDSRREAIVDQEDP